MTIHKVNYKSEEGSGQKGNKPCNVTLYITKISIQMHF